MTRGCKDLAQACLNRTPQCGSVAQSRRVGRLWEQKSLRVQKHPSGCRGRCPILQDGMAGQPSTFTLHGRGVSSFLFHLHHRIRLF